MPKCPFSFDFLKAIVMGFAFLVIAFMLKVPMTFQATYLILIGIGVALGYSISSGWLYVIVILFGMLLNAISFDYSIFGTFDLLEIGNALALFFGGWIYLAAFGLLGAGGGKFISTYQGRVECRLELREGVAVGEKVA